MLQCSLAKFNFHQVRKNYVWKKRMNAFYSKSTMALKLTMMKACQSTIRALHSFSVVSGMQIQRAQLWALRHFQSHAGKQPAGKKPLKSMPPTSSLKFTWWMVPKQRNLLQARKKMSKTKRYQKKRTSIFPSLTQVSILFLVYGYLWWTVYI